MFQLFIQDVTIGVGIGMANRLATPLAEPGRTDTNQLALAFVLSRQPRRLFRGATATPGEPPTHNA